MANRIFLLTATPQKQLCTGTLVMLQENFK